MPSRIVTGLPRLPKGGKLLLIKESGKDKFIVRKLGKKRKKK